MWAFVLGWNQMRLYIQSVLQQATKTLYGGTNDNKKHPDAVVSLLMFLFWQIESEIFVYNGEKKVFPHSLCKLPVGHDKPWTHHWLQLHLSGMMQMMTNSFIPHHVFAANRGNTQGWVHLGTWLRGWAAWLNHSEVACYQTAVRPLSQRSPLAGASIHLRSEAALTSLCWIVWDEGSTLFQFVTGWVCQCHSGLTHINVWLCI